MRCGALGPASVPNSARLSFVQGETSLKIQVKKVNGDDAGMLDFSGKTFKVELQPIGTSHHGQARGTCVAVYAGLIVSILSHAAMLCRHPSRAIAGVAQQ